jgi:hypothetical protein
LRKIENFREKRDRAKPIPLFEKFRDFSRNPVENTGLSLLEGVNSVEIMIIIASELLCFLA